MSDMKDKVKQKINNAADGAKKAAEKAVDKSRDAATVRARRWKKGESDFRMRDAFWMDSQ